jgi:hypothetical protein
MKKMHSLQNKFALALLLVPVVFLPGCGAWDWLKEKFGGSKSCMSCDSSAVLVSMKGKPVITMQSFEKEFDQLLEENPHLKSVLALMPDAKKNFLSGMVNQEIVDSWVTENKVDQKAEYKKELDRMMRSVKRMLNTKYFGIEHPVQVSENEVSDFYEKNKDSMPDLMVSRGGVQAAGVSFEKEADAKAFIAKVKEVKDIKKAADALKLSKNYRDFKLVNAHSLGMDVALRDKIVAIAKTPSVELIKLSDKSCWVVSATNKEETKYRPFDQVKSGLEQFVAKEKRMEMFDKEISKLKSDYNVTINEDNLKVPEQKVAENEGENKEKADQAVVAQGEAKDAQVDQAQSKGAANEAAGQPEAAKAA